MKRTRAMIERRVYHHKMPLAYCVAKPASCCAVFAVPPRWNKEGGIPYGESVVTSDDTARQCEVGKWYSIAYEMLSRGGEWVHGINVVTGEVKADKPKAKDKP